MELTIHKESVFVEEIKKVELRSRPVQFIYGRNKIILELGYSHAVMHQCSKLTVVHSSKTSKIIQKTSRILS